MASLLDLSFSSSISTTLPRNPRSLTKYRTSARQAAESERLGTNGRPKPSYKVVPTTDLIKTLTTANGPKPPSSLVNTNTNTNTKTNTTPFPAQDLRVLPSDEGFNWAKDNYNSWQRTADIWSFVLSLRVRVLFDNAKWAYADGFTEEKQKIRRRGTAAWLREQVLQLGPTFIKLGQLSSTRSDLFPREFVDELAKLQDRVPAFSPKKARASIESELGAPVNVLFKNFEDRPIAVASLGQMFDNLNLD